MRILLSETMPAQGGHKGITSKRQSRILTLMMWPAPSPTLVPSD